MVTGVETAGLVLATIPLIICALENYENAIGPTKAFIRWKGNLTIAKSELCVHHAAFDQTLRMLLAAVAGQAELAIMVEDTTNELWKRGEIAEDLERHLGKAHLAVMLEIDRIANNLLEITRHLNICEPFQSNLSSIVQANLPVSSSHSSSKQYHFRNRVKFTMKRQGLKERMQNIRHGIQSLTSFIEKAEKLHEGPSQERHTVKFTAPLESIRDNACKIHRVLLSRWCMSHSSHRAAILLEDRLYRRRRGRQALQRTLPIQGGAADCFTLCLDEHLPVPKWLSTEFRLLETPLRTPSKVAITVSPAALNRVKEPYSDPSSLEEVMEICSYLQERTDPILGLCLDDCHTLRAYSGSSNIQVLADTEGFTLTQILSQIPRHLANGDIYQLAIALAATVLQFVETPWLDDSWNKNRILFTKSCSRVKGNVDIKYPLLLQDFQPITSGSTSSTPETSSSALQTRTALLSLGIMLLEINSGQPLESFRTPQDLDNQASPDCNSDFNTAYRWLHEQEDKGRLSHGFSSAITACLKAWLNYRVDPSDREFCIHIQENVIRPLDFEMNALMHGE